MDTNYETTYYALRFKVLAAASMETAVFWVVTPSSLVEVHRSPMFHRCLLPPSSGQCLIALMMEAASRYTSTRLYGATTHVFPYTQIFLSVPFS
jgi:hypothetical protein